MVIKQKPFTEALFFCEQVLGESMLFEEGFGFFCFFFNSESILCLFGGEVNLRCYFLLTKKATYWIFVGYSEIINSAGRFVQIAKPEIEIVCLESRLIAKLVCENNIKLKKLANEKAEVRTPDVSKTNSPATGSRGKILIVRGLKQRHHSGRFFCMFRNHLVIAWRNLRKNRTHSFINISGLAIGMTVALLIGLWIWDELSFNTYDPHYKRVAQVMQSQTISGATSTQRPLPAPLGDELRNIYGDNFKRVAMESWSWSHILSTGDKNLLKGGIYMEQEGPELFGLSMVSGSKQALSDPSALLLSESLARALFGDSDPMGKTIKMDDTAAYRVAGVYADPPMNSTIAQRDIHFIAPWKRYLSKADLTNWFDNSYQVFVELADGADEASVSAKIKDAKKKHVGDDAVRSKPELFLHPMSKWHLYSEFKNGVVAGGQIQYVWLFGTIGVFVLLLACINFMNLSTSRSEKRAKEVGIRKTVGSSRGQLIGQFFCESVVVALLAFAVSMVLAGLLLPWFNEVAGKRVAMPWGNPVFWVVGLVFSLLTGIIAGSYPALYLSSFRPIKVLKGTFKAGRFAGVPRRVLVVLQFSVSVILIVGTVVVFRQIQYAKNRPVGYNREGLVNLRMVTDDIHNHFSAIQDELIKSGSVVSIAESSSPATNVNHSTFGLKWRGKDPVMEDDIANFNVSPEYGKTMGWEFLQGRDFSAQLATDSAAMILNETAVKYMHFTHPLGEVIDMYGMKYTVIGVIRDVVADDPFEPVKQAIYHIKGNQNQYLNIRIAPGVSAHEAIQKIEAVCKQYAPSLPLDYKFIDEEYDKKFAAEERIGKLAGVFAVLAVFISCLGLFGMASFMAEQRIKEIGVRKVLGASVIDLWALLSKDFLGLVGIALVIALPLAGYFMGQWLEHYPYRTTIAWWIFAAAGAGAILITMLTVSYQSIRAALANPVKSLRSE
jgi:putative ABC transport system permease protein